MRRLMQRTGISLTLSVNIAPSQVGDPALLDCVRSLIASEPAMRLILELTEESLLADDPDTLEALRQLTDTGARLAVDDFGVGYSSIGYLHRLPVDRIKIDKSLVQDLAVRRSYLLVQGVVAMARAMDLQVVVEGIEDVHTAVLLRDLGCQRAQGYLFSPPVDLAAAEFLLRPGRHVGLGRVARAHGAGAGAVCLTGRAAPAVPAALIGRPENGGRGSTSDEIDPADRHRRATTSESSGVTRLPISRSASVISERDRMPTGPAAGSSPAR
jgi:predicted signal transduction protein with EAL and GGDEF domain